MSTLVAATEVNEEVPQLENIMAVCPLNDEARKLAEPHQTPNGFLSRLIRHEMYLDALRFTAYKLSKREAIWWAALCLWDTQRPQPDDVVDATYAAIVRWIQDPSEPNRRSAEAQARQAGLQSSVGMLAMAIYFSGGSISLPECPEVEPSPDATAQQVAAAVLLATKGGASSGAAAADLQRRFLVLAADVDQQQLPWDNRHRSAAVTST